MKSVEQVRAEVSRRCLRNLYPWVLAEVTGTGGNVWPLRISLQPPSEATAAEAWEEVATWAQEWQQYGGPGEIGYTTRRWRTQGSQRLPGSVTFAGVRECLGFAGRDVAGRFDIGVRRLSELLQVWPTVVGIPPRYLSSLIALPEANFAALKQFLEWAEDHSTDGLFPRALSIPGVDTKWFEANRNLCEALWTLHKPTEGTDPFGLRTVPDSIQVKILDPALRSVVGGLSEFAASVDELSRLDWQPRAVIICENQQTGLSFDDMTGCVVIHRRGNAVGRLHELPWLRSARALYWGDLDTHGFAILSRLRAQVPHVESILMDEQTLLDHKDQWVSEPSQSTTALGHLTSEEQTVYRALRGDTWGDRVRLEQERVVWRYAMAKFRDA